MFIFAWMVCASALSFLDGKICAVREPSIIIIAGQASFATTLTFLDFPSVYTVSAQPSAVQCGRQSRLNLAFPECMAWAAVRSKQRCSSRRFSCVQATSAQKKLENPDDETGRKREKKNRLWLFTCQDVYSHQLRIVVYFQGSNRFLKRLQERQSQGRQGKVSCSPSWHKGSNLGMVVDFFSLRF